MPKSTPHRFLIVESPAKAKTIQGYLGDGYEVTASVGYIRDLPDKAADIPAKYKSEPWSRLGVDIENNFAPIYVVNADKRARVKELKDKPADADELLLATDEDREGEAIAWHLLEVPRRRCWSSGWFSTRSPGGDPAGAGRDPRPRQGPVDAQETRRILDRLYGYEVSPVLWKKVMPRLSAAVQSVALRLVVDRERDRMRFVRQVYADIEALLDPGSFTATLTHVDGQRIVCGDLRRPRTAEEDRRAAPGSGSGGGHRRGPRRCLHDRRLRWRRSGGTRKPSPPFATSTLQQEASRKLRWGGQRTMRVAQGCTSAATSPTCVPTRPPCRRRRSTPPGGRRGICTARNVSAQPRQVRTQGQERAGGARGHPSGW